MLPVWCEIINLECLRVSTNKVHGHNETRWLNVLAFGDFGIQRKHTWTKMLALRYNFQNLSMRLLLLISLCSKGESRATFKNDKKTTFVKLARMFKTSWIDKWAIRQLLYLSFKNCPSRQVWKLDKNKRYYKIQKGFHLSARQIQWSKFDLNFVDLILLHMGFYWLFWTKD